MFASILGPTCVPAGRHSPRPRLRTSHPVAAALAKAAERAGLAPLTATSLNRTGEPEARTREEAVAILASHPGPLLPDWQGADAGGQAPTFVVPSRGSISQRHSQPSISEPCPSSARMPSPGRSRSIAATSAFSQARSTSVTRSMLELLVRTVKSVSKWSRWMAPASRAMRWASARTSRTSGSAGTAQGSGRRSGRCSGRCSGK